MRPKTQKLVITFHTTAAAMAMEKLCKEENVPGRLIPVPRELTPTDAAPQLRALADAQALEYEGWQELLV